MGQETSPSATVLVGSGAPNNGVSLVRGIRRLLITVGLASLISSWLITASQGRCYPETGACVDMQLSASPLLFVGFGIIVFVALGRIIDRNLDPFEASRVLARAGFVVKVTAAVAIVVAQVWFALVPMEDFALRGGAIISPFPFGSIDVEFSTEE